MKTATLPVSAFKTKDTFPSYMPTADEKVKLDHIDTRFGDMQQGRMIVDRYRGDYQEMIDAVRQPYPDERSSSDVPLASSLIELYVAEAIKIPTEYNFKGETSKHKTNARILQHVRQYDWRKNNRKLAFIENEYITGGYGTSIIYTGFEAYNRSQKDLIVGDDLSMTWKEVFYKEEKIIVKNVDIRDFYLDDQAISSIDEAADCIYDQWMSFEMFQKFTDSPLYKNTECVAPTQYTNEYQPFVTQEGRTKIGDFVKLRHYWNVEKDVYVVIANGVLVREHPIVSTIDGKKALPFVVRVLGKKNYSIYGRGICEAAMMFNTELNNLREMLMDAVRRSNLQTLAIGNGLSFNGRSFSYDNQILTFDGDLNNESFQQISGNPPNNAIFSYIDRVFKDIAVFVGIDIQNIIGEPNQTAFQTEVQREASQKRVNTWFTNRDLAFERFANLHKDNLQKFFPREIANGLYPEIEIEGEELIGEGENMKFRKKKGTSTIQVRPEYLRGDFFVDVFTNNGVPTINAVDRQQRLDVLKEIPLMAQGYAAAKAVGFDLDSILPFKQQVRELVEDYNMTVNSMPENEEVDEAVAELGNELLGATQPMQQQPLVDNQPQGQESPLPMIS